MHHPAVKSSEKNYHIIYWIHINWSVPWPSVIIRTSPLKTETSPYPNESSRYLSLQESVNGTITCRSTVTVLHHHGNYSTWSQSFKRFKI